MNEFFFGFSVALISVGLIKLTKLIDKRDRKAVNKIEDNDFDYNILEKMSKVGDSWLDLTEDYQKEGTK